MLLLKSVVIPSVVLSSAVYAYEYYNHKVKSLCGTGKPDRAFLKTVKSFANDDKGCVRATSDFTPPEVNVDVFIHAVVASEDELNSLPDSLFEKQMEILNKGFAPSNMHFHLQTIDKTVNKQWATIDLGKPGSSDKHQREMQQALRQGDYRTLNIYYMSDVIDDDGESKLTGFCPLPKAVESRSSDFIRDGCILNKGTLPGGGFEPWNQGMITIHEVGHWNGLRHPFDGGCEEEDGGDMICDTPAELAPDMRPMPQFKCARTRDTCTDTHGPSDPGPDSFHNYMNYQDDSCSREFTPGQIFQMHNLWKEFRQNSQV